MSADGKKICVITGASGGIGRTIVKKFADNGFFTVLVDINEQQLASVIEQDGYSADTAAYRVLDISNESAVEETVADIAAEYGAVDVLVNAAGICGRYAKITDMDFGNMQKIYSVNVFGTFLMMRAALKIMVKQRSGAIVNFGSVSGMRGYTFESAYGSSKWAVIGMTGCAANEYGEYGIRVNSVSPGWVDTGMMKKTLDNYKQLGVTEVTNGPIARPAKPCEIADAVYYLSSGEASYITGANLVVDGGMLIGN